MYRHAHVSDSTGERGKLIPRLVSDQAGIQTKNHLRAKHFRVSTASHNPWALPAVNTQVTNN